jgi:hypothetical protein
VENLFFLTLYPLECYRHWFFYLYCVFFTSKLPGLALSGSLGYQLDSLTAVMNLWDYLSSILCWSHFYRFSMFWHGDTLCSPETWVIIILQALYLINFLQTCSDCELQILFLSYLSYSCLFWFCDDLHLMLSCTQKSC